MIKSFDEFISEGYSATNIGDVLDRDIYSVEEEDGKKYIHIYGYYYDGENGYALNEFVGCKIEIVEGTDVTRVIVDIAEENANQNITDNLTEDDVLNGYKNYFKTGGTPKTLSIEDVNVNTPCGNYIDTL